MKKIKLKFMLMLGIYFLSLLITAMIDKKYGTKFNSFTMSLFVGFFVAGWYNCEKEKEEQKKCEF